jgi:hypothetical protein
MCPATRHHGLLYVPIPGTEEKNAPHSSPTKMLTSSSAGGIIFTHEALASGPLL